MTIWANLAEELLFGSNFLCFSGRKCDGQLPRLYRFTRSIPFWPFDPWEWLGSNFSLQGHSWIKHQDYGRKKKKRKKALDCYTNSPRRHSRKCLKKSKENVHNNVKGLTSGKAAFITESREQIRLWRLVVFRCRGSLGTKHFNSPDWG